MYQALYRKYRPKNFDEVVGQEHITSVLKQEIASGRIGHAYLFTGSRGTGKTSCSKIIAKAVNCPHQQDGNPCGVCDICRGIDDGSILDVTEIDAASNNGVDNIRQLREEAGLKVILQVTGNIDADAVGADSFSFDFRQAGVEIGRRLLAEGRSKLYFIFLNQVTAYLLEGIRSAFAAAGKTPEVTAFDWGSPGVFSEIAERLRAEAPEALYVHGEHYDTVRDILDECGIDTRKQCRLVAESHAIHSEYHGLRIDIPFEETGFEIGKRIARHFRDSSLTPEHRSIPLSVSPDGL